MNSFNMQFLAELEYKGTPFVIVTVVAKTGHGPASVNSSMIVTQDGLACGTIGGGNIEYIAIKQAIKQLESAQPLLKKYSLETGIKSEPEVTSTGMVCGGELSLFYSPQNNFNNCIICGAGHVSRALACYLVPLGYRLTVIDSRPEFLENYPFECHKICAEPAEQLKKQTICNNTSIIVATHSHETDYQCLRTICKLANHPGYCGVLASTKKTAPFPKRISEEEGRELNDPLYNFLHMPCGLATGGTLPHDIAISITSQLQQWKHQLL